MIKLKQAVIVEGKYDKIKLSSLLDTLIIPTDGFSVFKDKEKLSLIRKLAVKRGIVILTDSDSAGFMIRSYIGGSINEGQIINAYIPDVFGKERRKQKASKEGKMGVEGMTIEVLTESLKKAGVFCEQTDDNRKKITKTDLYEAGLSGGRDSKNRRKKLLHELDLPEKMPPNSLVAVLNILLSYEEFIEKAGQLTNG